MIGAGGVELYGKARCAGPRQLFSVQPWLEAAGAARGQNPPRLGNRECPAVAENVTELRQPSPRHRRDQLPRQQVHVRVSPVGPAAKFLRAASALCLSASELAARSLRTVERMPPLRAICS